MRTTPAIESRQRASLHGIGPRLVRALEPVRDWLEEWDQTTSPPSIGEVETRTMAAMTDTPFGTRSIQPAEKVLLWFTLAYRIVGFAWLAVLAIAALATDHEADTRVVVAMTVGAGFWTILTVVLSRTNERIKQRWFVIADGVVALLVASASDLAGASSNLHGGYPFSWLAIVAYAYEMKWALGASFVLFFHQWFGFDVEGARSMPDKLGAVVFPINGALLGFGFDWFRQRDFLWRKAEEQLAYEKEKQARSQEQKRLADQLHDSVLQSMHAIQSEPNDVEKVEYIARRQERELRKTIRTLQSDYESPFVTAMFEARDIVEDLYRTRIDVVCGYDAEMTPRLAALVEATREAMMNAAKHSGSDIIRAHCALVDGDIVVLVRDEGSGFDTDAITPASIGRRLAPVGGTVTIQSTDEFGTEVEMVLREEV